MIISIQPVPAEAVDVLKDIALKTFTQSYRHLNTKADFDAYVQIALTREQLLIELRNEDSFFYFISSESSIIGYLKLNINDSQTEKSGKESLEIERIYLEANYQRKGIGRKMIKFAMDKAKKLSKSIIWLGVWDQNPEAIHFYNSCGFIETGSHIFKFGVEDQIDIIMEKSIMGI